MLNLSDLIPSVEAEDVNTALLAFKVVGELKTEAYCQLMRISILKEDIEEIPHYVQQLRDADRLAKQHQDILATIARDATRG